MTDQLAWPCIVQSGQYVPSVDISSLSPEDKKRLWAHLREHHHHIARQLHAVLSDPFVGQLLDAFEGAILLPESIMPASITAPPPA